MKILITGGNGFLGKRLGKRLSENGHSVVLASRNNKNNLIAKNFSGCEVLAMDVASIESVRDIINQTKPDVIIHGAATKFVDIAEQQPLETIDVNVIGSQNIARVAIDKGIKTVIGISTDKASPPVRNIYGMTKSLMERLYCGLNGRGDVKFACVRYGNVAWSTGSVLGIWKKMITERSEIGTTGPQMYRYFFTVDEAVQLVVNAIENIDEIAGQVLSREMKAAKLQDIIDVWVKYDEKISVKNLPERPGERVEEFLIGADELSKTYEKNINGIKHYVFNFNKDVETPVSEVHTSRTAIKLTEDEILNIIKDPPSEEM
jgi:UDP-N-acetylglucosamine 4,6-dehydratase/5-epimerase